MLLLAELGGITRVVVSTAAIRARIRGSRQFEINKNVLPHPLVKLSIVESLCDREVACSPSDLQGFNLGSCVWSVVSSHSSHHLYEVFWPNLACMCTKMAEARFISFHFAVD